MASQAPPLGPQPARKREARRSIAARLFAAVGLPTALLVIALGIGAWFGVDRAIIASLHRELKATATIAASSINPVSAESLLPEDMEDNFTYRGLVRRLTVIKEAAGSVRAMVVGDDELVRAASDASVRPFTSAPRLALDRTEFKRALAGEPAVSVPFESADNKQYLAAYALIPRRDSSSQILTELGLNASEKQFVLVLEAPAEALDMTREVATYLVLLVMGILMGVLVLAVAIARTITRPVLALAEGAQKLADGELNEPLVVPSGRDEVAFLGRTLEGMRRSLRARDEERQMMLAGIAHEVRNPLGGMELFTGLLEENIEELSLETPVGAGEKSDLANHAGRVRKELRYLTGVVNDFLAFARDRDVQRNEVQVSALLDDVASLKQKAGRVPLHVKCDYPGTFNLEEGHIKEALLNLVENAQQATPPDGKVTLGATLSGDDLVLSVTDTGKGMPLSVQEKVFQPFFTTKEKGSGLGLPLVAKFARDHGGAAHIKSEEGRGTTMTLILKRGAISRHRATDDEPLLLGDSGPNTQSPRPDDDEPLLLGDG